MHKDKLFVRFLSIAFRLHNFVNKHYGTTYDFTTTFVDVFGMQEATVNDAGKAVKTADTNTAVRGVAFPCSKQTTGDTRCSKTPSGFVKYASGSDTLFSRACPLGSTIGEDKRMLYGYRRPQWNRNPAQDPSPTHTRSVISFAFGPSCRGTRWLEYGVRRELPVECNGK